MTSKYQTIKVRLSLAKLHTKRQVRAKTEQVKIIKVFGAYNPRFCVK